MILKDTKTTGVDMVLQGMETTQVDMILQDMETKQVDMVLQDMETKDSPTYSFLWTETWLSLSIMKIKQS